MSMETGNPIPYWESMSLSRFGAWVSTRNRYVREENERAAREAALAKANQAAHVI